MAPISEDIYYSIAQPSEGIYKEKGSKFLAFAFPVSSEEEVKDILEGLRKKYYDARHHCYAYILGKDKTNYRANDDGEPNHSAGSPILGQIRSNDLSDILIVVVRYFGGTKLGVGGLITAYKSAAADAIAKNTIIEKVVKQTLSIRFDYISMNEIMKLIKDYDLEIATQNFDNICEMKLLVRQSQMEQVTSKLENYAKFLTL